MWRGYIIHHARKQSSDSLFCDAELITAANTPFSSQSESRSCLQLLRAAAGLCLLFNRVRRKAAEIWGRESWKPSYYSV